MKKTEITAGRGARTRGQPGPCRAAAGWLGKGGSGKVSFSDHEKVTRIRSIGGIKGICEASNWPIFSRSSGTCFTDFVRFAIRFEKIHGT